MLNLFKAGSIDNSWPYFGTPVISRCGRTHETFGPRPVAYYLRAGIVAIAEWRRLRRADREFQRLDDRILNEIGIARAEIGNIVRCKRSVSW